MPPMISTEDTGRTESDTERLAIALHYSVLNCIVIQGCTCTYTVLVSSPCLSWLVMVLRAD